MNSKFLPFLLLFCLTLITRQGVAQFNPNNLTHYPELSGTEIYDVIADRNGNIWIATQSGLVMFDGYEYKRFHPDPNDTTTIGNILTYNLYEDIEGNIWIGCMEYIYMYRPKTKSFTGYPLNQYTDFPIDARAGVYTISPDGHGRIYFGVSSSWGMTGTHALVYYDIPQGQMQRFESQDSTILQNVFLSTSDPHGHLWLAAYNGFFQIDSDYNLIQIPPPKAIVIEEDEYPTDLTSDSNGVIWMTTSHYKLLSYNPALQEIQSWNLSDHLDTYDISNFGGPIEVDPDQNLWIGLIFFDRQKVSFEFLPESQDRKLLPSDINTLCTDPFNNLWIGTGSGGLFKYNEKVILQSVVYKKDDPASISSGWVYKIIESSDGLIWMATLGGSAEPGLNIWDPRTGTLRPFPYGTFMPDIWNYLVGEIEPNELLFQSSRGFWIFNVMSRTVKKTNLYDIPDSVSITNLHRDSRSNLIFCTNQGLFLKSKYSDKVRRYDLSKLPGGSVSSNTITDTWESPRYGLWLLTDNGLFLYDYNADSITRYGYDKSEGDVLSSQDINSIYEDDEGILWVGTWQGGLCRYDPTPGVIRTYTVSDGLPSMSIQAILADEENGALWLSTFDGITRFSIKEEMFNNFSLEDGLQGQLFADASYFKTSDGIFFFGGNNGFNYFDPNDFVQNSPKPKVSLTDFKIANRSLFLSLSGEGKSIVLDHDENNISFDYVGIQYDNPIRNRYEYLLTGYDDAWREVGNQRTAYYYNLPPGQYSFQVRASNSNGVWSEAETFMHLKINPPWWKTWWAYSIYGLCFIFGLVFFDRIRRKRLLAKERALAREKELEHAREIEKAYHKLKTTQSQLIQSEKMASLGELTAGIAHEIQNPLNFVNNFSEVNTELIEEMSQAIQRGDYDEVKPIAAIMLENEKKVVFHGKRADAIVKNMLQHSRAGSGDRQETDINSLADEYLRLAYHGFRAKDKTFNVTLKTEFDPDLKKLKIVPQDIGRVLLNLITNAFYAVTENKEHLNGDYQPEVTVSTNKADGKAEIRVKDNGNGIPAKVVDKIFQPFFTTKPAGSGTGLGLSLSYDIVKAHGGDLKVESEENKGTEMIIILPLTN